MHMSVELWFSVIVCSCNILTDRDIRELAADPGYVPPRIAKVYERLGCKAECGRCARTIATIMRESVTMSTDASHGETPAGISLVAS